MIDPRAWCIAPAFVGSLAMSLAVARPIGIIVRALLILTGSPA
jgi:hypothetical protein